MSALVLAMSPPKLSSPSLDFDQLYRINRDPLYAYLMGMARNPHVAEELAAATFSRAYAKRHRFRARRGSPRAWLFGIAHNLAVDHFRSAAERHAGPELEDGQAGTSDFTAEAHLRIMLEQALHSLTVRERELVGLKFYAGLNNREIAQVVELSESNVGSSLYRILQKLREVNLHALLDVASS